MAIFTSPRYEEVVVHDLRTPLNVISLALRVLDESKAAKDPDAAEDIQMIRANAQELERMLVHLVDFSRLPAVEEELHLQPFDPRRLLEELVHDVSLKGGPPVELDLTGAPEVVTLDPSRTRMAFQKALLNAGAAGAGRPVKITLTHAGDRLRAEFAVDVPPKDSVTTHEIDADHFERLLGTPAERRGLDLSIAARISRLFGGTARLEARPGQGTSVILDWPRGLASAS